MSGASNYRKAAGYSRSCENGLWSHHLTSLWRCCWICSLLECDSCHKTMSRRRVTKDYGLRRSCSKGTKLWVWGLITFLRARGMRRGWDWHLRSRGPRGFKHVGEQGKSIVMLQEGRAGQDRGLRMFLLAKSLVRVGSVGDWGCKTVWKMMKSQMKWISSRTKKWKAVKNPVAWCRTAGAPKKSDQWWIWTGHFFPPEEVRVFWGLFYFLKYAFPEVDVLRTM